MSNALETWREKLAYFQQQEAITSDPDQKFALAQKVQEAKAKIAELESQGAGGGANANAPLQVAPTRLRHTAERLIGREGDLKRLDEAWDHPHTNVVVVRAFGGMGKTSLVAAWMADSAAEDWRGAERVFDWTFYSQGTDEHRQASSDTFIKAALEFFGEAELAASPASPWDKGAKLAERVAARRTLLVLDGLEPLQYPPGPMEGRLRDPAMEALLKGLAR